MGDYDAFCRGCGAGEGRMHESDCMTPNAVSPGREIDMLRHENERLRADYAAVNEARKVATAGWHQDGERLDRVRDALREVIAELEHEDTWLLRDASIPILDRARALLAEDARD